MKILFSEYDPDYSRYLYPYVVWALPEEHETPADLYDAGFHPASPNLDRFTLCRHLRVPLAGFEPSSENRRILRKGAGLRAKLVPRAEFDFHDRRRDAWLDFAHRRFGPGVMPPERLDGLMSGRVVSHLLVFEDPGPGPGPSPVEPAATAREVGVVLLYLEPPRLAHYYYAFYDLAHANRSLGLHLMTRALLWFRDAGFQRLYLGTCYSERALYKDQFAGIEFFNGVAWSNDLAQLRHLVRRDARTSHLLQDPVFLAREGGFEPLAARAVHRMTR